MANPAPAINPLPSCLRLIDLDIVIPLQFNSIRLQLGRTLADFILGSRE